MSITLGLKEKVKINGREVTAKIDSGADKCSLDLALAKELGINKIIKKIEIRSSHGKSTRPIVEVDLEIKDQRLKVQFNLTDRSHMTYKALIGLNVLKKGFIIDPSK